MVMTTSAARTTSSVKRLGKLPGDVHARARPSPRPTAGLIASAGAEPAERTCTRPGGVVVEQPGGHLGAARVVHADEQHLRGGLHHGSLGFGQPGQSFGGETHGQRDEEDADLRSAPQRGEGFAVAFQRRRAASET